MESVSLLYLPSAVALGALHALEPGHAKTLTAAYLIGVKGTKRDAVLLGLSVAFTHSIVVIGLSVAALWFGEAAFTDNATRTLQIGSAIVVICLGIWMVWKRLRVPTNIPAHSLGAQALFTFKARMAAGSLRIVDTPDGERMRLTLEKDVSALECSVHINRGEKIEALVLQKRSNGIYESEVAPEPREFKAVLALKTANEQETIAFEMHEPDGHGHGHDHGHSHDHLSDEEHARAHAATLPDYVKSGTRPTLWQILTFGAAGGMIPCPASVTVMLLALSLKKVGAGLIAVLGFSAGLALTLVSMGLLVVLGLSQLSGTGRFSWISRRAPIISAVMVVLSGVFALMFAH